MGYDSCAAVYLISFITALNRCTRGKLPKHWIVMLLCVSGICRLVYWKGLLHRIVRFELRDYCVATI